MKKIVKALKKKGGKKRSVKQLVAWKRIQEIGRKAKDKMGSMAKSGKSIARVTGRSLKKLSPKAKKGTAALAAGIGGAGILAGRLTKSSQKKSDYPRKSGKK